MINSDSLWCSCSKIYFIDGVPVFNIHIMENKLLPDNTRRFADVKFSPSFLFLEQNYGFDEDEKQVLIHHIWITDIYYN